MRDFPGDFLWGAATAAHQVEGGNTDNDWWAWEHTAGTLAAQPSGVGIDHWNRYDEDFALLSSLGHNAHRFSLEWSRVEPEPGQFARPVLDHYERVLESLHGHGITPFVTLHHKTLPRWFADSGGWLAPDSLDLFERYVDAVATRLGPLLTFACTVNEPQIIALFCYFTGQFPPNVRDARAAEQVNQTLMQAHRRAVAVLRSAAPGTRAGTCLQMVPIEALHPRDEELAGWVRGLMSGAHLDDLRAGGDVGDFVGLQYYTRIRVDGRVTTLMAPPPAGAETTQMGWEVHPEGFGQMLRLLADVGLPIVVTENGIATDDDPQRLRFLASHLAQLKAAMDDGVDVRGYLHWSAFDNFEWNHGYMPTFGLVGIDRADGLRRVIRPSAYGYRELARSGRLDALAIHPDAQAG